MLHITPDQLNNLLSDDQAPCISVYHSTPRTHTDNTQGPILFKNQLRDIKASLSGKYGANDTKSMLEKLDALLHDMSFWNNRKAGTAIFASPTTFHILDFHQPVKELTVVADTFHVKPLFQVMQTGQRYHVLALNRQEAKMYIGDKDSLHPVPLVHVPGTVEEALGSELTDPQVTWNMTSAGGTGAGRGGQHVTHQGRGAAADDHDSDVQRFFRIIDRGIMEHYTQPSGLPLMLAALSEYHGTFRALSHNPKLMSEGLHMNPDALSLDQLREHSWKIVEPQYVARLATLRDNYNLAKSKEHGADNLAQIAKAAIEGRVATLLIESDREIGGKIDRVTGKIKSADMSDPDVDDVLDDLAVLVTRTRGEVIVVSKAEMPSETGAAAIYRY